MYIEVIYSFEVEGQKYISSRPEAIRFENTSADVGTLEIPAGEQYARDEDSVVLMKQGETICKVESPMNVKRGTDDENGEANLAMYTRMRGYWNGERVCE